MLNSMVSFLKNVFGKEQEVTPVAEPEKKEINHSSFADRVPWPFSGTAPADHAILVLSKGVTVEDDHVFYYWMGEKRRHIRTSRGTESFQARRLAWWIEGRKFPVGAVGIMTICGEPKCIKASHLALDYGLKDHTPKAPAAVVELTKNTRPAKLNTTSEKHHSGDRSKCVSAKVHFPTISEARAKAHVLNSKEVRRNGRKVYAYNCPWCDGFHLTKSNPKKRKAVRTKGSWV